MRAFTMFPCNGVYISIISAVVLGIEMLSIANTIGVSALFWRVVHLIIYFCNPSIYAVCEKKYAWNFWVFLASYGLVWVEFTIIT